MADSHDLGQKGEELAARFLKDAGCRILHRNWKWGKNEIDIIAENRDFLIFAEVKTRKADFMMNPALAVTREKQRSIILAADGYLKKFNNDKECRFDIITVVSRNEDYEIEHMEGAFYPTLR